MTDDAVRAKGERAPKRGARTLRLSGYLPYIMSVSTNEVSRLIARAYEDQFDITIPQWRILAVLGEDREATPMEIGLRTVMDKVTVSRAARGLLQRALIVGRRNETDGRSHILSLTADGEALYRSIAPVALELETALLDLWSAADIERLKTQLEQLRATAAMLNKPR